MKQKYKKLAFFILLLSMLTGCMLLSGCTENKENGSQSSYIVDSDELQDTENQMEFVPGSMKGSKQEETSENEEQGQTEQSRQTVAEENDAEQAKTAGNLEVHFIDVGQGDGIFLRTTNGTTWLVDGGSSNVNEVGKYRILPFLNYYGEEDVDYACITHSDADHISGIRELLLAKKIRHLVMTEISKTDETSRELAALATENGADVIYVSQDSCWESGDWNFECLYPGKEVKTGNINDQSMVLQIKAGETAFLLTGDLTGEVENEVDPGKLKGTDVLKVAHHGSKYSSSEVFLKNVDAKLAVISCGKGNRYGHPAPETLERLSAAHMQIVITMDAGAVIMPYKKGRFLLKTWLK